MSGDFVRRTIFHRLERDSDLHEGIARALSEHGVRTGRVTGTGSVTRARLTCYDQKTMRRQEVDLPRPLEIVSLYGTIGAPDGSPVVEVHVVLTDQQGNGKGGNLLPGGTLVDSCELIIQEYDGPEHLPSRTQKPPAGGHYT